MRFPNVYDSASTPGIEPGSPAWELDTIPQRHSDIHLKRSELKLFIKQEIPSRFNKHKNLLSQNNELPDYIELYAISGDRNRT